MSKYVDDTTLYIMDLEQKGNNRSLSLGYSQQQIQFSCGFEIHALLMQRTVLFSTSGAVLWQRRMKTLPEGEIFWRAIVMNGSQLPRGINWRLWQHIVLGGHRTDAAATQTAG